MKFAENVSTVEGNAVFEGSVKATVDDEHISHIIRSLTDMYSNPYLAIAREYLSNGYDATIERMGVESSFGTILDIPVEVTTPSPLTPTFIVRDYGTGMDRDILSNVFLKYGASTKRDTNNQIGGFGLGAKSALAAVSSFTVVSVKNGKKNTGIIQKDAEGLPEISFLPEMETDEPSGTTVTIHLPKANEIERIFSDSNLLVGFPHNSVKLNGTLHTRSVYNPDLFAKISDTGWLSNALIKWDAKSREIDSPMWTRQKLIVTVGPISYTVNRDELMPHAPLAEKEKVFTGLMSFGVINLPIGSVDFTPAREKLIFSERTREAIISRAKKFNEEALAYTRKVLAEAPTSFDAIRLASNFRRYWSDAALPVDIFYKGEVIPRLDSVYFKQNDKSAWAANRWQPRLVADGYAPVGDNAQLVVVTGVKDLEEAKLLNTFRKAIALKDSKYAEDRFEVLFTQAEAGSFGPWADDIATDFFTVEEWQAKGVEYRKVINAEKRAANPTSSRRVAPRGETMVSVMEVGYSWRQTRPTSYQRNAKSLLGSVVIYMQPSKDDSDKSMSNLFAQASRTTHPALSTYQLLTGLAGLSAHFRGSKDGRKQVEFVRLTRAAKVENFLAIVPEAMSVDEAIAKMVKDLEESTDFLAMHVASNSDSFYWLTRYFSLDDVENEDVRTFLESARELVDSRRALNKAVDFISSPAFSSRFGGFHKKIKEANLYPLPLLAGRSAHFDSDAAVEYVNLKYPVTMQAVVAA